MNGINWLAWETLFAVVVASASGGEHAEESKNDRQQGSATQVVDESLRVPIGSKIPELRFKLDDGKGNREEISSASLLGKVIVLEFWGPFCTPCIKAFPHLNGLVKEFEGKPVAFISVADQGRKGCARILKRHKLSTLQVFDTEKGDASIYGAFGVHALPRTVIIDKTGIVVAYTEPKLVTPEVIAKVLNGEPVESHYKRSDFKP